MKVIKWIFALIVLLAIGYFVGPTPPTPSLALQSFSIPKNLEELERYVTTKEAQVEGMKPDNQARIVWATDSIKTKTPYSLVYLHGFSASQREGNPTHREFAQRYGCNLYLSRLEGHGIAGEDALSSLTVENYLASAQEAIEIGQQLGEKVIIMSTSTGGTLALQLATQMENIEAIIAYSPNIQIFDPTAQLLSKPWGLQLAHAITGEFREFSGPEGVKENWTTRYRTEVLVTLQSLLDYTMNEETFEKVKQPFFLGYYYKNEKEQDKVVSVEAMLTMFDQLGTAEDKKVKVAFPEAGNHCIASDIHSNDLESVKQETFQFAESILGLIPKQ